MSVQLKYFSTKKDMIYHNLRENIVSNYLQPGDKLVIGKIAKEYGVSEIPVREAFFQLEGEGLIKTIPHSSSIVTELSLRDYHELFLLRSTAELILSQAAMVYITEAHLSHLNSIIEEMKETVEKNNYIKYGELNKRFHLYICSIAPYKHFYKLIENLWSSTERLRTIFKDNLQLVQESFQTHQEIVKAYTNKDRDYLRSLLKQHRMTVYNITLNNFASPGLRENDDYQDIICLIKELEKL